MSYQLRIIAQPGEADAIRDAAASLPQYYPVAQTPVHTEIDQVGEALTSREVVFLITADDWGNRLREVLADNPAAVILQLDRPEELADFEHHPNIVCFTPIIKAPVWTSAAELLDEREVEFIDLVINSTDPQADPAVDAWNMLTALAGLGIPDQARNGLVITSAPLATMLDLDSPVKVHAVVTHSELPPNACVKAFGPHFSLEARTGDLRNASPGEVVLVDDQGAVTLPSNYQTPHRAALIEAYAVANGQTPQFPLRRFSEVGQTIQRWRETQ